MEARVYLGKSFIGFLWKTLVVVMAISIIAEIFFDSPLELHLILRILILGGGLIMIPYIFAAIRFLEERHSVFSYFEVNTEGMRITRFKNIRESISWEEIKKVDILQFNMSTEDAKIYYATGRKYLVFSSNEIFPRPKENHKSNFCIFKPNKDIYKSILPHLSKLSEEHQEEVKKFFKKYIKGNNKDVTPNTDDTSEI